MATLLKTTLSSGTLAGGASSAAIPHLLNITIANSVVSLTPDVVFVVSTNLNFSVAVTSTTVTFTNTGATSASATALLESWHSYERVFAAGTGPSQFTSLPIKPYIMYAGGAGGGGSAPVTPNGTMFYGLTAGTGNPTSTDYAATIAAPGLMPFPRLGPTTGTATLLTSTTFNLPVAGIYKVEFNVHTTEPGQLQLTLDGVIQFATTTANMNPTSGGHPINGNSLITTTIANSVLSVQNPPGNTPALTITPADGQRTHANAQTLVITRVA